MTSFTRGFKGRRREEGDRVPPGQYLVDDFPVLTAGPTPIISVAEWSLDITGATDDPLHFTWEQFLALPSEQIDTDIHCVTRWSKLDTHWDGVSVDTLLENVATAAEYVVAECYGGYTTNIPLEEVIGGKAWVAYAYDGEPLPAEHGGPARLLVPHLYLWKSAKWLKALRLSIEDEPGFWEGAGYHNHGDPWREERFWGD